MNIKCPYVYVECTTISGEPNCKGCPNFNLTPIEKEEWVDCSGEWDFYYRMRDMVLCAKNKNNEGIMHIAPRDYIGLDDPIGALSWGGPYRMIEDSNGFRIERRVVKKVCKECGKEI
jgi:hypothetical protein